MTTSNPISCPSPKQRFMESADSISKHRDMIDSQTFQRAEDLATLEFNHMLARETDMSNSGAQAWMMRGADLYRRVFRMLSEKVDMPVPRNSSPNLDHDLK